LTLGLVEELRQSSETYAWDVHASCTSSRQRKLSRGQVDVQHAYAGRCTCVMNRPGRVTVVEGEGFCGDIYIRAKLYESIGDVKYLYTFSMWEKCRRFSRDSVLLYSYFHRRIYQGEHTTPPPLSYRYWRQTWRILSVLTPRVYTILLYCAFHLNNYTKHFGQMTFD